MTTVRVFVRDQTDGTEKGIYKSSASAWVREPDFDGTYDITEGTLIPVSRGTANSDTWWRVTNTGTVTIGTTALTISTGLTSVGVATTSAITDESVDTTCFPIFVTDATGNASLHSGTNLTFNSATGELGVTLLTATGAISGTTVTASGIVSVDDTTDSTSGITGSIHTDGGIGAVKDIATDANLIVAGTATIGGINFVMPEFKIKASNESVTSSTTMQDDDDLQITLAASSTYKIDLGLIATSASGTPNIRTKLVPADGTLYGVVTSSECNGGVGAVTGVQVGTQPSRSIAAGGDSYISWNSTVVTGVSGGVFKLQWAQQVSDGTATTLRANSWMQVTKLT
jgi:hypothetical protein